MSVINITNDMPLLGRLASGATNWMLDPNPSDNLRHNLNAAIERNTPAAVKSAGYGYRVIDQGLNAVGSALNHGNTTPLRNFAKSVSSSLAAPMQGVISDVLGKSTPTGSTMGSSAASLRPADPVYDYADLARAYGMSQETAYQEALANTSYQRMVRDLQAAGLNPILATGRSGASSDIYGSLASSGVGSGGVSASSAKGLGALLKIGTAVSMLAVTKDVRMLPAALKAADLVESLFE